MVDEEKIQEVLQEVYMVEESTDKATGFTLNKRVIQLKGREGTKELIKLAKKEMGWD